MKFRDKNQCGSSKSQFHVHVKRLHSKLFISKYVDAEKRSDGATEALPKKKVVSQNPC